MEGTALKFNENYPGCNVTYPSDIGNGWCTAGGETTPKSAAGMEGTAFDNQIIVGDVFCF